MHTKENWLLFLPYGVVIAADESLQAGRSVPAHVRASPRKNRLGERERERDNG